MKEIQSANVAEKKVLLRVDFNVSLENGRAKETFKIKAAKESLDYLLAQKSKVALLSYFGRPEGKIDPKFSMEQLVEDVQEVLGVKVKFVADCVGEKVLAGMEKLEAGEVLLLENARFYPGEDENEEALAKQMAEGFDIFINDAFSQSHRDQASITGITKFLPSYAGFQLQKEHFIFYIRNFCIT
jgi:phosphoglycerate kinase